MRRETWDAIVIGSGSGGLTAALALARAGQRVLVLEQHYLPGGWMQSFSLEGHCFSPGVHYVGECGRGRPLRKLFEGLGLTQDGGLAFAEMNPEGFDHFVVGEERFDVPKGFGRLARRLCSRFPREAEGIRRYFEVTNNVQRELLDVDAMLHFPEVLKLPLKAPNLLRWGLRTQGALFDATVRDPLLKAFLSAQCGNHGLAPSRVSLPVAAAMTAHYYEGAYYPLGGAKRIPMAMIKQLRKRGGQIRLRATVQRILLEKDRAAGVELTTGEKLYAKNIVSNADPRVTFGKLLPKGVAKIERFFAEHKEYSPATVAVFAAVDMDLRGMGYDSGNLWWYRHEDVDGIYRRMERSRSFGDVDALFLALTSLKDPTRARGNIHTIEMFSFCAYDVFRRWAGTRQGERGEDYERLKAQISERMFAAAEHLVPGISKRVVFQSVATPLTNDFYCRAPFGAAYGTNKTPLQVGPFGFGAKTSIEGLVQCGASTLSHGVAGAALSGLFAAQRVLSASSTAELLGPADGSMRVVPADRPEEWLGPELERRMAPGAPANETIDLEDVA